jgi:hypothetical protein
MMYDPAKGTARVARISYPRVTEQDVGLFGAALKPWSSVYHSMHNIYSPTVFIQLFLTSTTGFFTKDSNAPGHTS